MVFFFRIFEIHYPRRMRVRVGVEGSRTRPSFFFVNLRSRVPLNIWNIYIKYFIFLVRFLPLFNITLLVRYIKIYIPIFEITFFWSKKKKVYSSRKNIVKYQHSDAMKFPNHHRFPGKSLRKSLLYFCMYGRVCRRNERKPMLVVQWKEYEKCAPLQTNLIFVTKMRFVPPFFLSSYVIFNIFRRLHWETDGRFY